MSVTALIISVLIYVKIHKEDIIANARMGIIWGKMGQNAKVCTYVCA